MEKALIDGIGIWIKGAAAAALHGIASGVLVAIVDPASFNASASGMKHVTVVALTFGVFGTATYLKQSPIDK